MRVDEIQKAVEAVKKQSSKKKPTVPNGPLVIHDVHILDGSSSMSGTKYNSATNGIKADIEASKTLAIKHPDTKSTMTIVEFAGAYSRTNYMLMKSIQNVDNPKFSIIGGMTALYDTIASVINEILKKKDKSDKVLMKIFTDGGENDSKSQYAPTTSGGSSPKLAQLIKKVQEEDNFTITFVGVKDDVKKLITNLNIDESNTLVHENTADSIQKSFNKTVAAKGNFMLSAMRGEDVSTGFYSKSLK